MTELDAGPVRLRDWGGAGAPVLLAHGMAAHSGWWDPVVPLWGGVLRAAALDFRGHGDSGRTEDGAYAPETWVEDVETARAALGWERFVLCGHSMGARIALRYAAAHPERLRGVVAIDFLTEPRTDRPGRFARLRNRPQPVYPDEDAASARFRLEPDGTALSAEDLRALGRRSLRPVEGGFTWKFDWRALGVRLDPVWGVLARVRVPALLARGEFSTLMSREDLARSARELPGARAVEIPGAHHHVPLDAPRALAAAIAAFAAGLPE
ncbi:MAG: alpha/beta hydrolase [Elusimicrobia bacterium]|nr:alpha/beta hydrolase [Elusimicrobiota bacterium]